MLSTIVFEIKKFKKPHAFMFVLCLAGVEGGGELRSCLEGNVSLIRLSQMLKRMGFLEFALPVVMKSSGVHPDIQNIFQLVSKILPTG